ncbi:MAG TPA: hypothetical protein VFE47_24775 [Tepidisphaeraceae bacterium]|jgi:hypothetical protein|nr:hypothetical protein [Tepidisphaeraceae bacterium]
MAATKFLPHVVLIPEDKKDEDIANGFRDYFAVDETRFEIRNVAGGWRKVLAALIEPEKARLYKYPERKLILLIDFDNEFDTRFAQFQNEIPFELKDRVFVIGSMHTPEKLTTATRLSPEKIGKKLAEECDLGNSALWAHEHLRHNAPEVARLHKFVRSILFTQ